jgi:hypothetical protein
MFFISTNRHYQVGGYEGHIEELEHTLEEVR